MAQLQDRTIIVTGGAQGIGASFALALAKEGANVAVCDIADPLPLLDELGVRGMGATCDVANPDSVREFVGAVIDRFGRIDGLVNNAALFASLKYKPFEEISSAEFDKVMQINVRGVFEFSRAVMPSMRAQNYGKIVNIASGTVFKGLPGMAHYTASKGAVIALTRVMAREAGPAGIRVNCIAPGMTLSDSVLAWGEAAEKISDLSVASRCLPRAQTPDDLNGTLVFLMSSASDFVTGQTVAVDGGSVML